MCSCVHVFVFTNACVHYSSLLLVGTWSNCKFDQTNRKKRAEYYVKPFSSRTLSFSAYMTCSLISWLHNLCRRLIGARRAERVTHSCFQKNRGRRLRDGCTRHSDEGNRCCAERRVTGHASARNPTTAAAAEAKTKTPSPPRNGWDNTTEPRERRRSEIGNDTKSVQTANDLRL